MKRMLAIVMAILLGTGSFAQIISAEETEPDFFTEEEFYVDSMSAGEGIRETDVTEPSAGRSLVQLDGTFSFVEKEDILARLNEIRLEACQEGVQDPRDPSRNLTEEDYVPMKWSSDLEWIAQTRAAEACVYTQHTRPNERSCFTARYNGVQSFAENLAWNKVGGFADILYGIEQWYEEKPFWLIQSSEEETGHYETLINPNYQYAGIGAFTTDQSNIFSGGVAGEFSPYSGTGEEQIGVQGHYGQIIEVYNGKLTDIKAASAPLIHLGRDAQLCLETQIEDLLCIYTGDMMYSDVSLYTADWTSADPDIAVVNQTGTVTGLSLGSTKVTANVSETDYEFDVEVVEHVPGKVIYENEVAPTYTETGSRDRILYCAVCGAEISRDKEEISKLTRETNTDTDIGDLDGWYSFLGDEDWFGWESYLNYNPDKDVYISGRIYMVDLPEDGRLQIELTADKNVFLEARIGSKEDGYSNETIWEAGSIDQPLSLCETSGVLKKGTYRVLFAYQMDSRPEIIFNWPPGKKNFYHKVTFLVLSEDEAAAYNVIRMIEALPSIQSLTLSDEASVAAAQSAYEKLTEEQKAIVGEARTADLADYTARIAELKIQALISIKDAKVSGIKSKTYNAKAQKQSPVVKVAGKTLVYGTDYTLSYKNNKDVGTATVTIKGKGKYTGSIKKTFRINPMPAVITMPASATKAITVK